jgi:hypothetical protein
LSRIGVAKESDNVGGAGFGCGAWAGHKQDKEEGVGS